MKKTIAVIPARLNSTRLPKKLLKLIGGEELIVKTYKAISKSTLLSDIYVATDSDEIAVVCKKNNIKYIMTDSELPSGSDRIHQAFNKINVECDYILNVQGDEPLIDYKDIDNLINEFSNSNSDVATIIKKIKSLDELNADSNVKVVLDENNNALYFSRAVIPYLRDIPNSEYLSNNIFYKHIGIYLYKKNVLNNFVTLPQGKLEKLEKLEQLRLLENNYKIFCTETKNEIVGVDTPEDLEKVRKILEKPEKNDLHK